MKWSAISFLMITWLLTGCGYQNTEQVLTENEYIMPSKTTVSKPPAKFQSKPLNLPQLNQGLIPVKISIPSIELETTVEQVGMLENGEMGVPKSFETVGWFEPGIKPGENGNAAIAGHQDHYTGPAVFFKLDTLKKGDLVMVSDANGKTLTFVVKSVESYKAEQSPLQRIFGDADKPNLNLITCAGAFNKEAQESEERLVVYTELQ